MGGLALPPEGCAAWAVGVARCAGTSTRACKPACHRAQQGTNTRRLRSCQLMAEHGLTLTFLQGGSASAGVALARVLPCRDVT